MEWEVIATHVVMMLTSVNYHNITNSENLQKLNFTKLIMDATQEKEGFSKY